MGASLFDKVLRDREHHSAVRRFGEAICNQREFNVLLIDLGYVERRLLRSGFILIPQTFSAYCANRIAELSFRSVGASRRKSPLGCSVWSAWPPVVTSKPPPGSRRHPSSGISQPGKHLTRRLTFTHAATAPQVPFSPETQGPALAKASFSDRSHHAFGRSFAIVLRSVLDRPGDAIA